MSRHSRSDWAAALQAGAADGWRGLEELLDQPEFRETVHREFPAGAAELEGMSRRTFVQLLGASLALAGLGACVERPRERILPYVRTPPEFTPGRALRYATAMTLGGYGTGLLVESHEGRPTKIEGNPDHPASLGAAGVYQQASLLQLYDPQRARTVRHGGTRSDWEQFTRHFAPAQLRQRVGVRGQGLAVLLEPTTSPVIRAQVARLRETYPEAAVYRYAPLAFPGSRAGAENAFGAPLVPLYDFRQADVVLALDSDFLAAGSFHLRYSRHFAERRRPAGPHGSMNRLYVVEPVLSVTGAIADHRLRMPARDIEQLLAAVLTRVVGLGFRPNGAPAGFDSLLRRYQSKALPEDWTVAVAQDLSAARGRSVVLVGESQPMQVHLLAHLLNDALGNVGTTISYIADPLPENVSGDALQPLVNAMRGRGVKTLVIVETNPVYTAPADFEFAGALARVPETVALDLFRNETGRKADWFVPAAHYLESWGDSRAADGTAAIVQPLIAPLYGGKTSTELLAALVADGNRTAHERVQSQWRRAAGRTDFEEFWDRAVQRGVIDGTAASPVRPVLRWDRISAALSSLRPEAGSGMELVFQADPSVYDGRFANNAWLQELPDPMTKLTWGNAALLSPATAGHLGIEAGGQVRLRYCGRELTATALVLPGTADSVVSLRFGYGRGEGDEQLAVGVGVNAYRLWTSDTCGYGRGLGIEPVPGRQQLATTQTHWGLEGRPIAIHATLAEYRNDPDFTRRQKGRPLSLYEEPAPAPGDQWAMTIDLSACTGCSACVVACQAENNVPVVGREGVLRSREMHWLRIDRYFTGGVEDPGVVPQPMLCQHCEKAPCEYVCPVNATVHSPDGLNEMVYNRCVGTRFCSNNCPYKVRRFNWFDYNAELAETERMAKNPDVTVRARGVMEKCTFCVQRIREAQIGARIEGREVRDGEVRTACQQACPTGAIVFGSLSDPDAEVLRQRAEPRCYSVLHELGTEPRVRYLARITNPNPALGGSRSGV